MTTTSTMSGFTMPPTSTAQKSSGLANSIPNKTPSSSLTSRTAISGLSNRIPIIPKSNPTLRRSISDSSRVVPSPAVSAKSDHQIVEPELEAAMHKLLKADALEHFFQCFDGNALLVFIAFHFIANEAKKVQGIQYRIDHGRGPRHNQRTAGCNDAVRLAQHLIRFGEMLENRKHHHVIELPIGKREPRTQISAHALPA